VSEMVPVEVSVAVGGAAVVYVAVGESHDAALVPFS